MEFCNEFATIGTQTTIFGKGQDLSYNIKDITLDKIPDIFDLTDTIFGNLEHLETNGRDESGSSQFVNYYQISYNPCTWLNFRNGDFPYGNVDVTLQERIVPYSRHSFMNGAYRRVRNSVISSNTDMIIAPFLVRFADPYGDGSIFKLTTVFNNQSLSFFSYQPEEDGSTNDGLYRPNEQERSLSSRASIRFDDDQFIDT